MQREKLRPAELPVIPGFELVRKLGRGGMGEVFEGVRLGSGGFRKPVALKTLNPGLEFRALERFLHEARISAQLEHPNIVRVYDLITVGSRYYLVMELLRGSVLSMLHEPQGVAPWLALSVADQALAGLAYAHAFTDPEGRPLGLIHRDLTPRNVFVCDSGLVKILDFGLAKLKDAAALALTQEGMVAGTPAYLSPEQANGLRLDARSDVYQLAATLYDLLTGRPPHLGTTLQEQVAHARRGEVTPLVKLRTDLPPGVVALVERALATDPARRFPNAQAMREAVQVELARCEPRGPEALARRVTARSSQTRTGGVRPKLDSRAVTAPELMALGSTPDAPTTPAGDALRPELSTGPATPVPFVELATGPGDPALLPVLEPEDGSGDPALSPQELVAGRYRIERLLAQGGMGAVYEAEDLELKERVALKTIRPELAGDERAVERFKQEIHLARRVTHPNVCRIFDIGFHPAGTGAALPWGRTIFFTMELVQGETLAQRLQREGRLSPEAALPLVTQLAFGLGAAHQAGVVHGDFKPENVLLELPREGLPHGRAVITDFGLARAGAGGGSAPAQASLIGTPAYISPEQVQGGTLTAAVDIYALGVVLYELLTGETPFAGDSPMAVALARVRQPPPPPSAKVPELAPAWEQVILRCLEREPAGRFQDAEDVVRALGVEVTSSPRLALVPPPSRPPLVAATGLRSQLLWVALGLVLLLVVGMSLRLRALSPPRASGIAVKVRRSVAVVGFQNLSSRSDTAWLSTALLEMMAAELGAGGDLRIVPGEDVLRAKVELAVADSGKLGEQSLRRLGVDLGADLILSGTYFAENPQADGKLRLDMQVCEARHGEVLATVSDTGTEAALLELISRTGASLRQQLGLSRLSTAQVREVASTLPERSDTARLYAEGLARLRAWDYPGARDLLEKAADEDPDHPLVHSALAATWIGIGDKLKARESARRALERATKLSVRDRLWVEGLAHESAEEWDEASRSYKALWDLAPDDVDLGVRLAKAQLIGKPGLEAARKTLAALRALPSPTSEDPRLDLLEAYTAQKASDFKLEKEAAARAAMRAEKLGARLLVAKALTFEAWGSAMLGNNRDALAEYDESRRICAAAEENECLAVNLEGIGVLRGQMGDLADEKSRLEEALTLRRKLGTLSSQLYTLNNLAVVLEFMGDLAGAHQTHTEALALARKLGDRHSLAMTQDNLANVLVKEGDLAGAEANFQQALPTLRDDKNGPGLADCLQGLSRVNFYQGDPLKAESLLGEALSTVRGMGIKEGVTGILADRAQLERYRWELAAARKTEEEALKLANELGEKRNVIQAHVDLAELALDEGHPSETEWGARQAVDDLAALKETAAEAHARDVLALALLAERKLAAARTEIAAAEALYQKGADRFALADHQIAAARVAGATDALRAAHRLELALPELARLGRIPLEYEARLALGELELAAGRSAMGKKHLKALAKDAREHRLDRVAHLASSHL